MIAALAWRNLWRNPKRTALTLLIVAVGAWAILAFAALLGGWASATRTATQRAMTGSGQIHAAHYLEDPSLRYRMPAPEGVLLDRLNQPPVIGWSARVRAPAVVRSEYRALSISLVGVDPASERSVSNIPGDIVRGRYLVDARDAGVVLGEAMLRRLKTDVGRRVVLMLPAADGSLQEQGFVVVGAFGGPLSAQDQLAFIARSTAQSLGRIGDEVSEITFAVTSDAQLSQVMSALKSVAPKLEIKDWTELAPFAFTMAQLADSNVALIFTIVFALVAIGIINSQLMAVFERSREFGLLQAVGMRPRLIALQVTIESAILAGIGVIVGASMAVLLLFLLRDGIDLGSLGAGAERLGAARVIHVSMNASAALQTCIVIWILCVCAAMWPALRAAHANPISAMRAE